MSSIPESQLTHPKYRPEIDGLRAIAVLAVIGFHAFPSWIRGGFIGVDIFFVISGFLISNILLSSLETQRFSFIDFYAHRIRRIFPALTLVLATCLCFGWFALLPSEYLELGKQTVAGSAFAANILFWRQSGYFDVSAELKPLLHLWSLGVEEQFYIVWPVLLWFAWKKRFNLFSITILITLASLVYGLSATKSNPVAAFYSPTSRTWELLLGALLAYWNLHTPGWLHKTKLRTDAVLGRIVYTHPPEANGNTLRDIKALFGLGLIIIGIFIITKERRFPGGWALLPTIGAFLLIAAGPNAWANRKVLSQKIIVWIGLISYPLYLWHWPLLSFARIMEGETPSRSIRLAAVGLSFVLAVLTYWLIERPIRWGKHLTLKAILLCLSMAVCAGTGFYIYKQQGFPSRLASNNHLTQFEWPETLNRNELCEKLHADAVGTYCVTNANSKTERIVLIGDSHANHLYPGLAAALPTSRGLTQLGNGGCLPFLNTISSDIGVIDPCVTSINKAMEIATNPQIDSVILSSRGPLYSTGKGFGDIDVHNRYIANDKYSELKNHEQVFEASMRDTLSYLQHARKKTYFILDIPELGFDPQTCFKNLPMRSVKSPCAIYGEKFDTRNKPYRDLVHRVLKDYPNVTLFDAAAPFCDDDWCWAMKDGKLLYRDDDHLSVDGSNFLAKELIKVLQ